MFEKKERERENKRRKNDFFLREDDASDTLATSTHNQSYIDICL